MNVNPVKFRQAVERTWLTLVMESPDAFVPVAGSALPDEEMLSRAVRDKALSSGVGTPIGDDGFEAGNYVVVVDVDRLDDVPEELLNSEGRTEFLRECEWEVYINALGGVGRESGELIRDNLLEMGECYDAESGEIVPGYHDPRTGDAVLDENKPYVIVNST